MVAGKRMNKAKGKPPILTLSPEHEQQAIDKLKRLFAERFESIESDLWALEKN